MSEPLISITFDKEKGRCRLVSDRYDTLKYIIKVFTTENKKSFFIEQHGFKSNPEITMINGLGYFDIGLFPKVYKALMEVYTKDDIKVIDGKEIVNRLFPLKDIIDVSDIKNISETMDMRPYQYDAVTSILKYGRGIVECPTASGKSFIIANVIHNLFQSRIGNLVNHVMIYVPYRQLVDQFYTDLLEYGYTTKDVCKFSSNSGKKKDKTFEDNSCSKGFNKIIITNRDYVKNHLNEMPKIDMVICDELHTLTPESASLDYIKGLDTNLKLGLTGSVPREEYERWTLIGSFGDIIYTESIINLQKQKYLAELKIISLDLFDQDVQDNKDYSFHTKSNIKFDKTDTSEDAITFNEAYNAEIKYINDNLYKLYKTPLEYICNNKDNRNILILFDRIEFGKGIYAEAKDSFIDRNIHYVDGTIDVGIREKIRQTFEEQNGSILFAQSKTFSTGINIKNLDCIAFFFSGKGFTKIIQSIGRTLRLHKDKTYAKLYDISFNYKYSRRHKAERKEIYKECYGKEEFDETVKLSV